MLPEFGINSTKVSSPDLEFLNLAWHRLDPWPDSVPGLLRLKQRFIIAPLSNGNLRLMIDMGKRAGLPWDAILGAEVAQAYKPAPEAYLRTAEILMIAPEQICLVAAHNGDLAAARRCGMRTAFVPRPTEHGSDQTTDLSPTQDWDVIAVDFVDLACQLGA
jgi:2-haloacid dehalogenase